VSFLTHAMCICTNIHKRNYGQIHAVHAPAIVSLFGVSYMRHADASLMHGRSLHNTEGVVLSIFLRAEIIGARCMTLTSRLFA